LPAALYDAAVRALATIAWLALALAGGAAFATIAAARGEPVSAATLLLAAISVYAIAYRFYAGFLARRVLALDARRPTPAVLFEDGRDFVPTNRWVVFGHHFAAIAGPGPLLGPVLAAQFGWLPGALWILFGVALGGAVQDFVILVASTRRGGRSLATLARECLGPAGALAASVAILLIMVILIAVLGVVIVNTLAESPWGLFTVAATIPIALGMGVLMRGGGGGGRAVAVASALGVAALGAALVGGYGVSVHPALGPAFTRERIELAWAVIGYGLAASALPIWLLLAPRDYLSTFLKLGTIAALALGIAVVRPPLLLPATTRFIDGSGPLFGGKIFPFCFITIACGAISGFHALVASGTTPRLLERETDARMIGYGGMLLESFVAIMALTAAAALPPGEYLAINAKKPLEWIAAQGPEWRVSAADMDALAARVGEKTLAGRTGGAPCLAVGMAEVFRRFVGGERVAALWYHFAIMFEALFILTTLDAGTRVGRFLLQDALSRVFPRAGGSGTLASIGTSVAFVAAWGGFVLAGAADPAGGIRALWPLFGIANQLLAASALAIATTIFFRTGRARYAWVTLTPLGFLLVVTGSAGIEKIFDADPRVGFLALAATSPPAEALSARIDAGLAAVFLALVAVVVASGAREWARVLAGRRPIEPEAPVLGSAGGGAADGGPPSRELPRGPRCCC
jgi:carbon starvation protein